MGLKKRLFLFVLGLILVALGVRGAALTMVGVDTRAEVTEVRRVADQESSDYNYNILYRFYVDGQEYSGQQQRSNVYNITTLPNPGETLRIRYVPGLPFLNGPEGDGLLGGVFFGFIGILLLLSGLKPKRA